MAKDSSNGKSPAPTPRRRAQSGTKTLRKERRDRSLALMLTPSEQELVHHFVKKYRISNKSEYFRKVILTEIFTKLNINYPTLFEEEELSGKV